MNIQNNETLFWRVFNNKTILNYIVYLIQTTKQEQRCNGSLVKKCKFKDTHSLEIMLKNNLYSLIKDKIKHGDHIEFTKESISLLFNKHTNYSNQPLVPLPQEQTDEMYSISMLLLERRRFEFEICDLTLAAIQSSNLEVLQVLINEPYSIIVYPSSFLKALYYGDVNVVKELFLLNERAKSNNGNHGIQLINDNVKSGSLKNALFCCYESRLQPIVEYVLDNPSLYSIPSSSSSNNSSKFVEFRVFLKKLNNKIKNKLMDLDIVKKYHTSFYDYNLLFINIAHSIEDIKTIIRIHQNFNIQDQVFNNLVSSLRFKQLLDNGDLKQLQAYLSTQIDSFYLDYKMKYKELIDDCESKITSNLYSAIKLEPKEILSIYLRAIKECNIEQLDYLKTTVGATFNKAIKSVKNVELPESNEEIVKLAQYFSGQVIFNQFNINSTDFYELAIKAVPSLSNIHFKILTGNDYIDLFNSFLESISNKQFLSSEIFIRSVNTYSQQFKDVKVNYKYNELSFYGIIASTQKLDVCCKFREEVVFIYSKTFEEVMEIIRMVIGYYPREISFIISDHKDLHHTIDCNVIVNFLYDYALRIKNITLDQLEQLRDYLIRNSIPIDHYDREVMLYCGIRDSRLLKYITDRPPQIVSFYQKYSIREEYSKFIKPKRLSFDFIFGSSFEVILNELINQLSHNCLSSRDLLDHDPNEALMLDLFYCLEINRVDLFFRQMEWINGYQFNTKSIQESFTFNSANSLIKPTSTLFVDRDLPNVPLTNCHYHTQPTNCSLTVSPTIAVLVFSKQIIKSACNIMDVEEIQQLLEFKFYETNFVNDIFDMAVECNRLDLVQFILDNYSIRFQFASIKQLNVLYLEYMLKNQFQLVKDLNRLENEWIQYTDMLFNLGYYVQGFYDYLHKSTLGMNEPLSNDEISKIHNKFQKFTLDHFDDDCNNNALIKSFNRREIGNSKGLFASVSVIGLLKGTFELYWKTLTKERSLKKPIDYTNELFTHKFIQGDIKSCNLILQHYEQIHNFTITNQIITDTIEIDNIHIIKYYYNQFIKTNNELVIHLKFELSKHRDYKFDLNWL